MGYNSFSLSLEAQQDVKNIWLHIAKDSVQAAERIANKLEEAFLKIAINPNMGSKRDDLTKLSVRFWVVHGNYIIYNPEVKPLQILRVISSYRNINDDLI